MLYMSWFISGNLFTILRALHKKHFRICVKGLLTKKRIGTFQGVSAGWLVWECSLRILTGSGGGRSRCIRRDSNWWSTCSLTHAMVATKFVHVEGRNSVLVTEILLRIIVSSQSTKFVTEPLVAVSALTVVAGPADRLTLFLAAWRFCRCSKARAASAGDKSGLI